MGTNLRPQREIGAYLTRNSSWKIVQRDADRRLAGIPRIRGPRRAPKIFPTNCSRWDKWVVKIWIGTKKSDIVCYGLIANQNAGTNQGSFAWWGSRTRLLIRGSGVYKGSFGGRGPGAGGWVEWLPAKKRKAGPVSKKRPFFYGELIKFLRFIVFQ